MSVRRNLDDVAVVWGVPGRTEYLEVVLLGVRVPDWSSASRVSDRVRVAGRGAVARWWAAVAMHEECSTSSGTRREQDPDPVG